MRVSHLSPAARNRQENLGRLLHKEEEACGKSCRRYAQKESRRQGKRGMGDAGTNSFLSLAGLQSCFPSLYFAGGRRTVRIFPVFPPPQKN